MEIIIILLLIILNGLLAMAEIAIITSKKARLQQKANEGDKKAQLALELANSPNRYLSTIQIGITLIGILAGAFAGTTIADYLAAAFYSMHIIHPYSDALALFIVVLIITYLSLVIGELVPKRIALSNPEKIATLSASYLNFLSVLTAPIITLLSISTDFILKVFRIQQHKEDQINEDDIKALIKEGAKVGILKLAEKDIVERTFQLADKKVSRLMTPRSDIIGINIHDSFKVIRNKLISDPHSYYPVYRDSLDHILGVIKTEDLLSNYLLDEIIDIRKVLLKPLFVPETADVLYVLELFKKTRIHVAFIVDEFGSVQGSVWLHDILEGIVGDIQTRSKKEKNIIKRSDGSYLVDGFTTIDEFKELFKIRKVPGEKTGNFHTIGGFVMYRLGKIPVAGDKFEFDSWDFEIMDMDRNRIDKLLIKKTISK